MKQKFTMPDGELIEKDFPQWKTPWNHDTNFESDRTGTFCHDQSLTKQEFKEDADINVILARALKTGEMPVTLPEHFTDLTERTDYFTMASKVAEANALFYELPAAQRALHQNDPTRWADKVVEATIRGDADALEKLGVDLKTERNTAEKALAASKATPPPGDTPDPKAGLKPPAAPKPGTPSPDPSTDPRK